MAKDTSSRLGNPLLVQVLAWGTAALFAVAGYYLQPKNTHLTVVQDGKVYDIDLISVRTPTGYIETAGTLPGQTTPVLKQIVGIAPLAKGRGGSLIAFALWGVVIWWIAVAVVAGRRGPNRSFLDRVGLHYALLVGSFFLWLIADIVDLLGWP